jgi:CDP-glycerol glycerophosphotransferase
MKYIEEEIEGLLNPQYVKASKKDSTIIDLMLSSDSLLSKIMKESFWYDGEVLEKGIPRNDLYFKADLNTIEKDLIAIDNKLKIQSELRAFNKYLNDENEAFI